MENKGIDYGMGKTNIDQKTGIRFGVINQNKVLQAWADSSEPFYINSCPHCGNELQAENADYPTLPTTCPNCHKEINDDDLAEQEPVSFLLDDGEYIAEQSADDGDIFIVRAPYFTYAQFCSPCAPGAGYIMNEIEEKDPNNRAYCFGHDFFDDGRAPYKVYDVKTGKEVLPE